MFSFHEKVVDRWLDRWFDRMRWVIWGATFMLFAMGVAALAVAVSTLAYLF